MGDRLGILSAVGLLLTENANIIYIYTYKVNCFVSKGPITLFLSLSTQYLYKYLSVSLSIHIYMYIHTHTDQYLKRGCVSGELYSYSYTHSAVNTLTRPWSSVLFSKFSHIILQNGNTVTQFVSYR